jgi:guanosine-3',5'-bis(diphosphate) 3'-pyrophosphohydrolase
MIPPEQIDQIHDSLLAELDARNLDVDRAMIRDAFDYSNAAHAGQFRKSGEPFMYHPVEVVKILIDLLDRRVDTTLLAAALLHDVVEDTDVTGDEIARRFSPEIAQLVDGVTKITGFEFGSTESQQAENFRKMLLSMARDIRVILIKLADRLHNMRTLDFLSADKAQRISRETMDIYAPLAHRLGIGRIKWELEDLSFKHLDRDAYRELVDKVALTRSERERLIEEIQRPIAAELEALGIRTEISGRPKHLYSVYRKMTSQGRPFNEIFDLLGVRVIVPTKADCYRVLGVLHDLFTPVHERFKDYIATPKSNMYQSLHTTVIGPEHKMVEVQIRTADMHRTAELGIAAHYSYKEGRNPDSELEKKLGDLFGEGGFWAGDTGDPGEFMDFLKTSLYQDEVFVFTPKGELKRLPKGSTPLDLAYLIHTDVGHRTVGAKINGRIVSLKYELKNGDSVQIITAGNAHPTDEWLSIVRSSRARQKVRRWLTEQRMEHSVALGREMIEREGRRFHKALPAEKELIDVAQSFGFPDVERLLRSVGEGHVGAHNVLTRLFPEIVERRKPPSPLEKIREMAIGGSSKGLRIQDVGNLMIYFAKCCQPVPGDQVVGVITRGRGLSVHRMDCPNAFEEKVGKDRRMDLSWDVSDEKSFVVKLVIHGSDRQSLLADVAAAVSATRTNIKNAGMQSVDGEALGTFIIEVKNLNHLQRVMKAIKHIKGVRSVERQQVFDDDGHETRH